MDTKYYSCKDKNDLDKVLSFEGNHYSDWDISVDVIGIVNTNPSISDEEGSLIEEKEPIYTDFLFNVRFITNKYKKKFKDFKEENPKTPFRKYL